MSLSEARDWLDEALLALPRIADPRMPVQQAEREISGAQQEVYTALAASADYAVFRAALAAALAQTQSARAFLFAFESEDAAVVAGLVAVTRAITALEEVTHAPRDEEAAALPRPGDGTPFLTASVEVPRLLELERGVLLPAVPLPERAAPDARPAPLAAPPPPIRTLAELRARMAAAKRSTARLDAPTEPTPEVPPEAVVVVPATDAEAEREHQGVALTDEDVLFDRARSCLEDLAMLGLQRRPLRIAPWHAPRTEARLLAKIDALAACGARQLPRLVRLLDGRPLPDPELTWALLFLFGSIAGDDALDTVHRLARLAPLEARGMRSAVADALALAPHPGIVPLVRGWLRAPEPARRALAVRVLERRRVITPEEAIAATRDPAPQVVLAGTRALAGMDVPAGVFLPLLAREEPRIVRAAMMASLLGRSVLGLRRAAALVKEGQAAFADAALIVAIAGDAEVQPLLAEDAASRGSRTLVHALGWYGHVGFVPYLIGRLGCDEPALRRSAAWALFRITGAALAPDAPLPDYPPNAPPFHPAFARAEPPIALADTPAPWQAFWDRHGRNADPALRYRHGRPFSPKDDLDALSDPGARPPVRRVCHVELVARTGGSLPFDSRDFIARQRLELGAWGNFLAGRRDLRAGSFANRLRMQ